MDYEWDENKNAYNKRKHGISFEAAIDVFDDPYRKEYYDNNHSDSEDRWITIGKANDILYVVFTERNYGNTIRLISARRATKEERGRYYDDD